MNSKISCPGCHFTITLNDDLTPRRVDCPECSYSFHGEPIPEDEYNEEDWEYKEYKPAPLTPFQTFSLNFECAMSDYGWTLAFGACGAFFVVGLLGMFASLNNTEGSSGLTFALMMMGAFVFAIILWAMKMGTESGWEPPDAQTQRNNQRFIGFQQRKEMNEKLEDIRDSLDQD